MPRVNFRLCVWQIFEPKEWRAVLLHWEDYFLLDHLRTQFLSFDFISTNFVVFQPFSQVFGLKALLVIEVSKVPIPDVNASCLLGFLANISEFQFLRIWIGLHEWS